MSLLTPILIVIAVWWFGTGIVLYLQQRIAIVRTPLIATLSVLSIGSLIALYAGSNGTQPWHSYVGFIAAIVLWGCIELSYYTGLVSGVHKRACPDGLGTTKRFKLALGASIWHEVSVLFTGGVVVTLLLHAQNPAGLYSFLVLWLMRWSSKLNLFFGVPNFNTDWFPKRLAYAHSYIRRAPVTLFFPLSVLVASLVAIQLITSSLAKPPTEALTTLLPAVLLLLAILEHLFMALPIADSELWNRIFARDDIDPEAPEQSRLLSAQLIQARVDATAQGTLHKAIVSTNRPVSVTIGDVDNTATQTVSR